MNTILIVGCWLISLSAIGQLVPPDPERATLVFFREYPSRFGGECWACNYRVTVNKRQICNLSENRFIVYAVPPGNALLETRPARGLFGRRARRKLVLQVNANSVYYLRCDQQTDETLGQGALVMRINDAATAIPTLAGMKMDACGNRQLAVKQEAQ